MQSYRACQKAEWRLELAPWRLRALRFLSLARGRSSAAKQDRSFSRESRFGAE